MFYQVLIETSERVGKSKNYKQYFELDRKDLSEIECDVIIPYLTEQKFQFDGYFIHPNEIKRIVVKQTNKTTEELSKFENDNMSPGIIMFISKSDIVSYDEYTTDITKHIFSKAQDKIDSGISLPLLTNERNLEIKWKRGRYPFILKFILV